MSTKTLIIAMILAVAFCMTMAELAIKSGNEPVGHAIFMLSGWCFGSVLATLNNSN